MVSGFRQCKSVGEVVGVGLGDAVVGGVVEVVCGGDMVFVHRSIIITERPYVTFRFLFLFEATPS